MTEMPATRVSEIILNGLSSSSFFRFLKILIVLPRSKFSESSSVYAMFLFDIELLSSRNQYPAEMPHSKD